MISIDRRPEPNSFTRSKSINRWRLKAVVKTLWEMQNKKCCYCEKSIPLSGHSKAVEHFAPKSKYVNFVNTWENLLLVCSQCNGEKLDKFPLSYTTNFNDEKIIDTTRGENFKNVSTLLINPSDLRFNPEAYIEYVIDADEDPDLLGMPRKRNNSRKGHLTINILGLYKDYHVGEARKFIRNTLMPNYRLLLSAWLDDEPHLLREQKNEFERFLSAKHEYAAVAREFARARNLSNFGIVVPGY